MGNTSSREREEPDPWWGTNQQHQNSNQNDSLQTSSVEPETPTTPRSQEDVMPLHAMWYQRERVLGQTIQHLAEENMRISSAKQLAEKRLQEFEAEVQHNSEEVEKLRNDAEKAQQVFEKLHAQIQSGREDRQMITSEMERIRRGFDAERESKDELIFEMKKLREERDENKRAVEKLTEQLKLKSQLMEKTVTSLNQEMREKEYLKKELESLREELKIAKESLDSPNPQEVVVQQMLKANESETSEESTTARLRSPEALAEMERFQAEMCSRREARQKAMQAVSSEMERLRSELNIEREGRQQITKQLEQALLQVGKNGKSKQEEVLALELEHAQQKILSDKRRLKQVTQENSRLQYELDNERQTVTERTEELEKLQTQIETEREQTQRQIDALKEVSTICKEMLNIREGQVLQLKEKLRQVEASVSNKVHEKLPVDLKTEYENQMVNIRNLKRLYEERMKLMLSEKEKLVQDSEEKSQRLDAEIKKSAEFEQQLADMKLSLEEKEEKNSNLQIQLDDSQDKSHGLAKELTLINNLFTQMLIGGTATDMDLDRLTRLLQENHDLITDITIKENCSEIAAVLPKLVLDLVNQVDSGTASTSSSSTEEQSDDVQTINRTEKNTQYGFKTDESHGGSSKMSSEDSVNGMAVQDIAVNLPKVWKVLMELLSHHIAPTSTGDQEEKNSSCYKSVDTPSGPRLVISVSQTFLRLKDLILEKKSLQKELDRLQHLNGHLERKLNDQENKLSMVSSELRKTWNVVDQMQTQHQKLHTHEKILRYELHEKRLLLSELKQELEYCREKWERARQKNSDTEIEWKKLRKEFASRKKHPNDVLNNSGESGFLDERTDDSCEDDDSATKDTGPLDPGIGELPNTEVMRTSSPLETNFPQVDLLIDSQRMNLPPPVHNSQGILNQTQTDFLLDLESNSLPNNESVEEQNSDTELNPSKSCLNSFDPLQHNTGQDHLSDCRVDSSNDNCSTISIITMLKQQLAFFSRNLDYISTNSNNMSGQNLEALQSIFSLPPIQIPKSLKDTITGSNSFNNYNFDNFSLEDAMHDFNEYSLSPMSVSPSSHLDERVTPLQPNHETIENTNESLLSITLSQETNDTASPSVKVPATTAMGEHGCDKFNCEGGSSKSDTGEVCQAQSSKDTSRVNRTPEEIAEARAARLKRLEEQCQQLYNKVAKTSHRSNAIYNRLEELHEQFGRSESPPGNRSSTSSSVNNIPIPPPLPSTETSSQSTSVSSLPRTSPRSPVNRRHRPQESSKTSSIPPPPPLPCELPTNRIPTSFEPMQSESLGAVSAPTPPPLPCKLPTKRIPCSESTTGVPSPPPLPQTLPTRRLPTCTETNQTDLSLSTHTPPPPPLPQSLRGRRLPTEMQSNVSDTMDNTNHYANETTIRHVTNDVQRLEEQPTTNSSTDVKEQSSDKH